jgi:predicted MarR family transcription regulator
MTRSLLERAAKASSQEPGPSTSVSDRARIASAAGVGQSRMSDVDGAYRAMQAAFIRWHVTGCFAAAADYTRARTDWELSLMNQPTGDAE